MTKTHASAELLGAMGDLLAAVRDVSLDFSAPDAEAARMIRVELADQISDYVLPRLVQLDAPLLAVVGGSTGAGKSTLVNSIVGRPVTQAGILRPTTRSPVLVHHPDDTEWFARDRLLPDLERVGSDAASSTYGLRLLATDAVPQGLALLDAPDVDSVDESNRELAGQLLAAADLWLFVTSAARYADQVPWEYLRRASERATSLAVVLDRTDAEAVAEVRTHLARMMTTRGLSDSPLFTVTESELTPEGLVPPSAIAPISGWLHDLAADPRARRLIVGRTIDGAVRHVVLRSHDVADAMDGQVEVADTLYGAATAGYAQAVEQIGVRVTNGSLMTGEVLARWQALAGSGDLTHALEEGRKDRSGDAVQAIESAIQLLVVDAADRAAEHVARTWATTPSGARLVEGGIVDRASTEVRVRAERVTQGWRESIEASLRSLARSDVERVDRAVGSLTLAVMTELLVRDGGRRDGVPVAGRRLLDAAFEAGTDELVQAAFDDLHARVDELLGSDRARFLRLVRGPEVVRTEQSTLRDAARGVEAARHADTLAAEQP